MDTMTSTTAMSGPLSLVSSGQASAEAIMRSTQIWTSGFTKLGEIMAETARGHFEQTASLLQAMGQVKTLKEAVDIQTNYTRSAADHLAAGAKKLVEASAQLTQEVMAPITERFAAVPSASGLVG